MCIHLCTNITQPRRPSSRQRRYASRFKLILQAYNRVRQRVMNSETLLERTNLTLFVINECTLMRWFKNKERRDEVTTLLQGVALPPSSLTTTGHLPAAQQPSSPGAPPEIAHEFEDPEDTSGQADVRGRKSRSRRLAPPSQLVPPLPQTPSQPLPPPPQSLPPPAEQQASGKNSCT